LTADLFGPALQRLATCARLEGDRLAAAHVRARLQALVELERADEIAIVRPLFSAEAVLEWGGERLVGREAAAARWLQGVTAHPYTHFHPTRLHGDDAFRVTVEGTIRFNEREGDPNSERRARVRMVWSRDSAFQYTVERASVSTFEPVRH
jgi:hypothetical protein